MRKVGVSSDGARFSAAERPGRPRWFLAGVMGRCGIVYSAWAAKGRIAAVLTALVVAWSLLVAAPAFGAGIPATVGLKDCVTPINVGDPYSCEAGIVNIGSQNSLTVDLLTDVVFASVGDVTQSYAINQSSFGGGLILTGGATCDASKCTLPPGGGLMTPFFSEYTAVIADVPVLADQATFRFRNLCDVVSAGCNTGNANGQANAEADIIEPPSSCQPTGNPSGNSPGAKGNGPTSS